MDLRWLGQPGWKMTGFHKSAARYRRVTARGTFLTICGRRAIFWGGWVGGRVGEAAGLRTRVTRSSSPGARHLGLVP